jgi:type VI secretion system secreted protein VgrG
MKGSTNHEGGSDPSFQLNPPQKKAHYYAEYGGRKDEIYGNTHIISVKIQIDGVEFFTQTNVQLEIRQKINDLHKFTLTCVPEEFGENNETYLLRNTGEYLGKRITFQFRQFGKTTSTFIGIITRISTSTKGGIRQIILTGNSPCILMENGPKCRSFENKTFQEIIKEISKDYPPNLINFHVNPNNKERLDYIVQYNSSDLQFLQQISRRFGEYFYYNGEQFCFSAWGGKIIELMEGEDIYEYELSMEVQPQTFSYTAYDAKQGTDYLLDSEIRQVQTSQNPFQQHAQHVSKNLYNVSPTAHYDQSLLHQGPMEIERSIEREKNKRQNLVYIKAGGNNPNLRVGDVAKMMACMPKHEIFKNGRVPIESYRITEIVHTFADGEGYRNTFIGVPRDLPVPPYYERAASPKAHIQHAVVTDNKDPLKMGRVRVQFTWQRATNSQTPWVQVIQLHSGSGKGTYFNPEIGETVLCAFQGGNAEAPIVLGTAYNGGEIAAYYTEGNDIKVMQTRSGIKIVFNDAEEQGTLLIEDPSGNRVFMDGKGNMKTHAPKNIEMTAGENMNIKVGKNLNFTVGNEATWDIMEKLLINAPFMQQLISTYFHTQAGKALINSENQIKIESPKTYVQGAERLMLHSDELATLNSQGIAEMKGETKNSLSNKSNNYEPHREKIKAKCIVMFRPHNGYKNNPDFGFDWLRVGDSGQAGDNWFGNIMGKYYEKNNITVFGDTNNWNSNFKKDMKMYNKLLRSYTSFNISWKDKWTGKGKSRKKEPYLYPIPVLTLLQGRSALFNLKIEIEEEPQKLTFEFKDKKGSEFFELNVKEINDIRKGKYDKFNYFKITCKKESPTEQLLYVKADGEICGAIRIHPNTPQYQNKIKVVFVKVTTDINGVPVEGICIDRGKEFFKQNFNQALVIPDIVEDNLDCIGNELKKKFCTYEFLSDKKTLGYKITNYSGLQEYLENKLIEQFGDKYDSYYRMYFIGEEASWNGFSYFNSKFGVYFKGHNKGTVAHETMHAMNLPHTFDGKSPSALYTYEVYKTNNLLDYSHHIGIERHCLFLWQWKILNPKIR